MLQQEHWYDSAPSLKLRKKLKLYLLGTPEIGHKGVSNEVHSVVEKGLLYKIKYWYLKSIKFYSRYNLLHTYICN